MLGKDFINGIQKAQAIKDKNKLTSSAFKNFALQKKENEKAIRRLGENIYRT